MEDEKLELVRPAEQFKAAFFAMVDDFKAASESRYDRLLEDGSRVDFSPYLKQSDEMSRGVNLKTGQVPMTLYWLLRNGAEIVGEIRLRHPLNEKLKHFGGNIGYAIRPGERKKGYGTRMLALTLAEALGLGLTSVILTCDTSNVASARVIVKNGGRLVGEGTTDREGKLIQFSRYEICIQPNICENGDKP